MDEAARQRFHAHLDTILDHRAQIEPAPVTYPLGAFLGFPLAGPEIEHDEARKLFLSMIELAREALGEGVRRSALNRRYRQDSDQRAIFKSWLFDIWPLLNVQPHTLLAIAPDQELSIFEVMDALSALDAGEIRPLFRANTGKNRRANRWSLARSKLEALAWKKRLRVLGYAEKAANFEVTKAFQEQWDTIRKWRLQCEQILGPAHVSAAIDFAGGPTDYYTQQRSGGLLGALKPDPLEALRSAGGAYRSELKRSAELSKRKSRAPA